jgi:hypothetical protein
MSQSNISSSRAFIFLILSTVFLTGIIGTGFTDYALGQRASGPGGIETEQPNATRGPLPIVTKEPEGTTETTLATTTTATTTYSTTRGGLHISTTITNTTTVIPVKP